MNRSTPTLAWALWLALVIGASGGCNGDDPPPLAARFDYVLPARFEVPDLESPEGDHEVYVAGDLHPDRWLVELDACASTGSIVNYTWSIDGAQAGVVTGCDDFEYPFPAEGSYSVSLVVEADDGELASRTVDVVVNDLLIFGVGDSYGSGEGNPDVAIPLFALEGVQAARAELAEATAALDAARLAGESDPVGLEPGWTQPQNASAASALARVEAAEADEAAALELARAQWQNRRCHRSAHSGQVRAAKLIEEADPHTSVSFVHLACSGARVHKGLLGGYAGIEPEASLLLPQIQRVAELAEGREIDALVVSIGGNDVNFSSVIEACIVGEPCHEEPVEVDSALRNAAGRLCTIISSLETECTDYFDSLLEDPIQLDAEYIFDVHSVTENENGDDIRQDGNDDLPDNYRELADAIAALPGLGPDTQQDRVYLTEIPDITRNLTGQVCGWDTMTIASAVFYQIPLVTQSELTWASDYVTVELRETMRAAAAEHGWQFVEGISTAFRRHGYCSLDPWVVRLPNTFLIQGDPNGAVHPNQAGHGAYAKAVAHAITR